jgi:hypothetical protein
MTEQPHLILSAAAFIAVCFALKVWQGPLLIYRWLHKWSGARIAAREVYEAAMRDEIREAK